MSTIRVGIVGLGANCELRHVPGLRQCPDVEIVGVCNRRRESTQRAAAQFGIPNTYDSWEQLVADDSIDAVVVGTWPYLHSPITIACLDAGKHVLTEARMAMNLDEARKMEAASARHPDLVAQIVPSPFGLQYHQSVVEWIESGRLGALREVVVLASNDGLADPGLPIHWRQIAEYSGINMLALGIVHEPLIRWLPDPETVIAQTQTFTERRPRPDSNELAAVETPDSVHVLAQWSCGARGVYHLSGTLHFGPAPQIHLYGSEGTLKYHFAPRAELWAGTIDSGELHLLHQETDDEHDGWRVEEEFIGAIRGEEPVKFTDFASGVRYMNFTQAVADSAAENRPVALAPL